MKKRSIINGFTLVELMIVVAIIGILASLAIPDFMKMIAKTKQSEAKTNLAAIYTCQLVYYGAHNVYAGKTNSRGENAFDQIGYQPESVFKINYTYIMDEAVLTGRVDIPALPEPYESTAHSFMAIAVSNIDNDETLDIWTINENRMLIHVLDDVRH